MALGTRPAERQGLVPFRQGDLDGLCGVYAIVNAMRALHPRLGRAGAEALFSALVHKLLPSRQRDAPICTGLSTRDLRTLIGVARRHLRDRHGVDIQCVGLGRIAGQRGRVRQVPWLWSALTRQFENGAVAIVGLGARHNHWTVVVAVTSRTLWLADSGGMQAIRRSACERERIMQAGEVFVLSRHDPLRTGPVRLRGRGGSVGLLRVCR